MRAEKRVPEKEVSDYLARILDALGYVHERGRLHRDLKPDNILLTEGGPVISDFGMVAIAGEGWVREKIKENESRSIALGDTHAAQGDSTKALLGTFEYMSPEQKECVDDLDQRSDLWAVGLMAYQMLTGERAVSMGKASEINPMIEPAWDEWLKRALAHQQERAVLKFHGDACRTALYRARIAQCGSARPCQGNGAAEDLTATAHGRETGTIGRRRVDVECAASCRIVCWAGVGMGRNHVLIGNRQHGEGSSVFDTVYLRAAWSECIDRGQAGGRGSRTADRDGSGHISDNVSKARVQGIQRNGDR